MFLPCFINVMVDLPREEEKFIVEKAVEGWEPDLIGHSLRTEKGSPVTDESVEEFLGLESTQERIEKEKRLIEKRAEVSREDLIRELNEQISILRERSEHLRNSKNDDIGNDTTKNLLKAVRDLADMIDVLESKEGSTNNTVNINKLEQNIQLNQMVEHLPREEKRDLVEQLEEDPDIQDFVIERKQ